MDTLFQSTPLNEGRRVRNAVLKRWITISIHTPQRGATCWAMAMTPRIEFQSTPLNEGRQ